MTTKPPGRIVSTSFALLGMLCAFATPAWAHACNTPWRLFKHYNHEGGVRTPCIVHWPAGIKTRPGALTTQAGYITDFMPTLLEVGNAKYPRNRDGTDILPHEGTSLVPALRGEPIKVRPIFIEHEGNRSLRDGEWKLVALQGKPWELYNLTSDPTEMHDLAAKEPARVQRLAAAWEAWADRCQVREKRRDQNANTTPETPRIANQPLRISCEVNTTAAKGVILAQGGREQGYALHLSDGRPIFTVRIDGKTTAITGPKAVSGKFTLTATLTGDGMMTLAVNGQQSAEGMAPGLIPKQPQDELSIGKDEKTAVGDYDAPNPLDGEVTNVKIRIP